MEQGTSALFPQDQQSRVPSSLTIPGVGGVDGSHERNAVRVNDSLSASGAENEKIDTHNKIHPLCSWGAALIDTRDRPAPTRKTVEFELQVTRFVAMKRHTRHDPLPLTKGDPGLILHAPGQRRKPVSQASSPKAVSYRMGLRNGAPNKSRTT